MKAQLLLIGCVLFGALLGWPAGVMVMRFYVSHFGPRYYRSIDEPRRIFLCFTGGGVTLGALLGAVIGSLAMRTGVRDE